MPEFFLQIHIFITQLYFYWNWLFVLKGIKEKKERMYKNVGKSKQCNFCNVLVQCTVYFCKQGKQGSVLYIYIFSFCKQCCCKINKKKTKKNYIQSLNTDGLQTTLKWAVGSSTIPPLGLPKKLSIQFLHGCVVGCRCRPTTSTCALKITLPVHHGFSYS